MRAVAESFLLPIWANRNTGEPCARTAPGAIGHVVRVGPNRYMPVVQEFSDGGVFAHEDCAPASIQSRCIEQGIVAPIRTIEQIAGTGLGGTKFNPGCLNALHHFGVPAGLSSGNPPAGYIANPMIVGVQDIGQYPRYLAATQGGCLIMGAYTPPPPAPPPPLPTEADMDSFFLAPKGDANHGDFVELPGIRAGMSVHLASQDRTGLSGVVVLVYCEAGGKPDASHAFTLVGTVAGVHGPVTGDIATATLAGATEGSLTFENLAPFPVMVSVTVP